MRDNIILDNQPSSKNRKKYIKNNVSVPDHIIFQPYLLSGIISINDVVNSGMEDIMKTILDSVHHYAVQRTKDGRYTTYIPDSTKPGGRRQIRKKSRADLYRYLLAHYGLKDSAKGDMSFSRLYSEWINYKRKFVKATNKKRSISPSTIRRYERDFKNYVQGSRVRKHTDIAD